MFLKDDYSLERIVNGTRSACAAPAARGFKLERQRIEPSRSCPRRYEQIHAQTMMPVAHLIWSGAWAGIAAGAVDRARAFVRKARAPRATASCRPAPRISRAPTRRCAHCGSLVAAALRRFEAIATTQTLESLDFQTAMNLLKVNASELAVATVMSAMQACGLSGYRNDSEFSIGRHLRDILSSPIMINNDRILANVAAASLLSGAPASLRD